MALLQRQTRFEVRRAAGLLLLATLACQRKADPAEARTPGPETPPACSAAKLAGPPRPQPGLPAAVAETRRAIASAAVTCDYAALAALARRSKGFVFSFGPDADAAAHWRAAEQQGRTPLADMVRVLALPYRVAAGRYVWPAAAVAGAGRAERDALRSAFSDLELATRLSGDAYVGMRVGVEADGAWSFAVAGD